MSDWRMFPYWYYTAMNGSYITEEGVWMLADQPEFFEDPCTTFNKHKGKIALWCIGVSLHWYYTMVNTSYYTERCANAGGPAGVFWGSIYNFVKHKYKGLDNCLQTSEMSLYEDYTINASHIIQEGVWRPVDQPELFRDPCTTFINTKMRWIELPCNV